MNETAAEQVEGVPSPELGDDTPGEPAAPPTEADEEAEAEEAESHDAEQGEPELEQPEGLSQQDIEARLAKIERSAGTFRAAVERNMAEDFEVLQPCPLCEPNIPGYILPSPDAAQRFPSVLSFLGQSEPRELEPDTFSGPCPACAGWGVVTTGSKVQGKQEMTCLECGGNGAKGKRFESAQPPPVVTGPTMFSNGEQEGVMAAPDPPEAEALRKLGYAVIKTRQ